MAEYIERDALLQDIEDSVRITSKTGMINPETRGAYKIIERIKSAAAADVVAVRHGRWIDKGEYAVCTECGGRSGTQYDGVEPIPLMTQFCQNCGAKMGGGVD